MILKWEDTLAIAISLDDAHGDSDPQQLSLQELHRWICDLKEFDDDPDSGDLAALEAIRAAWIGERE
jgi:FeS assembly protein IscX